MAIQSFPVAKGKNCENPSCQHKAAHEKRKFMRYGPIGERLLDQFLSQENAEDNLSLTHHVKRRAFEKAFSDRDLFELIESGSVIAYDPKENKVIILGYIRIGKGEYRPLHIPIIFKEKGVNINAVVKTAFDPKFSSHLYDESFRHRHCWCQPIDLSF